MKTSENTAGLSDAILKVQAELKNPAKNKVNPHYKSKYADLPSILETLLPITSKHGVSIFQGSKMSQTGIILVTRLQFKNEWVESEYPVCQFTTAQAQLSALTYARRAALQLCGLICGEDDLDGEDSKEVKTNVAPKKEVSVKAILSTLDSFAHTAEEVDKWWRDNMAELNKLPKSELDEIISACSAKKNAFLNGASK